MNSLFIAFLFTGLLLCALGLLVWKKQMVSVIGGNDPQKCFDPVGLAWWVGRNVFLMGVSTVAMAILSLVAKLVVAIVGVYALVILIGSIITVVGCRRFIR